MGILRLLQLPEAQKIKDLDNLTTVGVHNGILERKRFLKKLYLEFYGYFAKAVPSSRNKIVVEIGTGSGFLKSVMPRVITSDISYIPGVNLCFSAQSIPFKENVIDAFYMLNVFHHIKAPCLFFDELLRCLKPRGKIIMIEPANTLWGKFIYKNFHHEDFNADGGWAIDGAGPLSAANIAMPYIIFIRDKKQFESRFPALKVKKLYFHTPFSYLISGGFSIRQLLPGFLFKAVRGVERILSPFSQYLGMFMTIEIEKTAEITLKEKIQRFWGDLYKQWYADADTGLSIEILNDYLVDLEQMFEHRKHLAVIEMPLKKIRNKQVLEIGSGSGAHSALFKKYGANVTAVDITKERVISTAKKLGIIKQGIDLALQADAENLPFNDDSFDFVYSNGVLHHSENTEKCLKEVLRVLKPKGKAVLMLYSRNSALFWLNLLPCSIFSGMIFRYPEPERIGILTEGKPKFDSIKNPITRVYSNKELRTLFNDFEIESLRKSSFSFSQIPILSRISRILARVFKRKAWKSGVLVYGAPNYVETKIEMKLGEKIGFAWNIIASKKASGK